MSYFITTIVQNNILPVFLLLTYLAISVVIKDIVLLFLLKFRNFSINEVWSFSLMKISIKLQHQCREKNDKYKTTKRQYASQTKNSELSKFQFNQSR